MAKDPVLSGERWRYLIARRLLQQGRRDRALVVVGELLRSDTGRPHALQLLAEIYGKAVPSAKVIAPEEAPAGRRNSLKT